MKEGAPSPTRTCQLERSVALFSCGPSHAAIRALTTLMSDTTYPITLPNGQTRGPLRLQDIKKATLEGALPLDATIVIGGLSLTLGEAISEATKGRGRNMTEEERAILGGTRASTPMAIMAQNAKQGG